MDRKTDLRLWAVLFWLAVWQIAAMALAAVYPHGELLLASPADVLLRLGQLAVTAAFWRTVAWSAVRIFGGFLLATVLAVALAALAAWKQWLRGLMAPLVAAVKAVPVASFIILALVWLNSRSLSLFISALMVFPPVYLNVLEGICRTDRRLLEMALPYCNIVCITGSEMKDKLSGYLQVLADAEPSSVGGTLPGDDFYYGG